MPFGLTNAPAVFQRFLNHILYDLLDVKLLNYLDDTMPATETREENVEVTCDVLRRFCEHKIHCRAAKCTFLTQETEYLGLQITKDGIEMDKWKIEAIEQWPTPKKVKDVQSFLGFCNFYRRFIKDFAKHAAPMTNLTRKEVKWEWTPECEEGFNALKRAFASAPVLVHFDPEKPAKLETDALGFAYGAVLSQKGEDGKIHPVSFMSKAMSPAERRYDIWDKEFGGVIRALRFNRHYLEGAKFPVQIFTDHKNLEYFKKGQILRERQYRWMQELSHYNYNISYIPGETNGKADPLSCRQDHRPEEGAEDTPHQENSSMLGTAIDSG